MRPLFYGCTQGRTNGKYCLGIFGWYPVGVSRYFTNRYQRQTRLVHFGIKKMAGAPFSPKKEGGFGPLFEHFAPLLRKKGKEFPGNLQKVFPPKLAVQKYQPDTNRPVLVIYQYRPGGGYYDTTLEFWQSPTIKPCIAEDV